MHAKIWQRLRSLVAESGAAGIVASTTDNVSYLSGYECVMDGWRQPEPISAVFIPSSPELPVTLFIPEANLVGLVVAERQGTSVSFESLRTFEFLNFCVTARAQDAHLRLAPDLVTELEALNAVTEGPCHPDIIASLVACLEDSGMTSETILFDDIRVALAVEQATGQRFADGLETLLKARAVKTPEEIALFRECGMKADRVMEYTVSQLERGRSWAEIEKAVAHFMIDEEIDPLPVSPMLFGGSYDDIFKPDLFRTPYHRPFSGGEIAILETQGVYRKLWIDINRTAYIGHAPTAYREQHKLVQRCFEEVASKLRPGANSVEICESVRSGLARELDAPEKLLMIVHSIGRVPLESPVRFPATGIHAATEGFEIQPDMLLSFDCLYFGSRHGPSHMENVFHIGQQETESIYAYPLELIETG